jgi:hypothetical protein
MDFEQRKITKIHDFCMDFDRHVEETSVDALPNVITRAGKNHLRNPVLTQLPDWIRAISAIHDIRETAIEQ